MNQYAIDIITKFEGCKLKSYQDLTGVWTCGIGSTGPDIGPHTVFTQEQANERLWKDLERFKSDIDKMVTVIIDDFEEAALLSFCYNLGSNTLKKSTLLKLLNNQQPELAANEFTKFCYAGGKVIPGLLRRRNSEKELFLRTS